MPKKGGLPQRACGEFPTVESSIESENEKEEDVEDVEVEEIKISKKTGKPVKKLSILQLENLKIGREKGLVVKKLIKENKDITKTTAYIKEFKDKKNLKIEENNKILNDNLSKEIINEKETVRKSIKKKKKKYIEVDCSDSEESESDGIVIKKEEIIVPPIVEDSFSTERLLRQKLYNDRVDAITKFMLNKNK